MCVKLRVIVVNGEVVLVETDDCDEEEESDLELS